MESSVKPVARDDPNLYVVREKLFLRVRGTLPEASRERKKERKKKERERDWD